MKLLIAIPAYNEEAIIVRSVLALHHFLAREMEIRDWVIVIAENGSTDATPGIAASMAADLPHVRHVTARQKGKGSAIRTAWLSERADVYAFMDADLATDLSALPRLVAAVARGADVAIGSRFHRHSTVDRGRMRSMLSHGYRIALKTIFDTGVSDAPCGFKAANHAVVERILPTVRDNEWFFDTELLLRAERAGLRVEEIPVIWREHRLAGRASKVALAAVAAEYLSKMWQLHAEL